MNTQVNLRVDPEGAIRVTITADDFVTPVGAMEIAHAIVSEYTRSLLGRERREVRALATTRTRLGRAEYQFVEEGIRYARNGTEVSDRPGGAAGAG